MQVRTIRTPGLGDSSYVVEHDGVGLVVDPQRDIDRFEAAIGDIEVRAVVETHVHNDYISGGRDLAARQGAELIFPAGAAPSFKHTPAFHLEDIQLGHDLVLRPLHTPGHTPEHTSYLLIVDGNPELVFSGGSLLVGSAGRSDLLGIDRAESLSRLQYGSVNRLSGLGDDLGLYPTHGAGSFCTTTAASSHTSTIGAEKISNPVLAYADEDSFVGGELSGLVPYPSYYQHMGPANLVGPPASVEFDPPALDIAQLWDMRGQVQIVDARAKEDFASGHIAGSLGIELRNDFASWVGWLVEYQTAIALVLSPDQDPTEPVRQLYRIGFEDVRGFVTDLDGWPEPLSSYEVVGTEEFSRAVVDGVQVLDVRAPNEREHDWITNSSHSYVPDLFREPPSDIDTSAEVWVACGTGYRANIAASRLEALGHRPRVLVDAGVTEVLEQLSNQGQHEWCSPPALGS